MGEPQIQETKPSSEAMIPNFVTVIEKHTNKTDFEAEIEKFKQQGLKRMQANAVARYTYYMNVPFDLYKQSKTVLDGGAGEGFFKEAMSHLNPETTVTSVDLESSLKPDIIANIAHMPTVENNSFDIAIANYAIPNRMSDNNPEDLMAKEIMELYRVTKEKGTIIFTPIKINFDRKSPHPNEEKNYKNVIKLIEKIHAENPKSKFTIVRIHEPMSIFLGDPTPPNDFIEMLLIEK